MELRVTLLVLDPNGWLVGRCELRSPYIEWDDISGVTRWSLCMPIYEWVALLWTLVHSPQRFMKVTVINEEMVNAAT